MKKKSFKAQIDNIIGCDTPEKQAKEIEILWKAIKYIKGQRDNALIQLSDIKDRECY